MRTMRLFTVILLMGAATLRISFSDSEPAPAALEAMDKLFRALCAAPKAGRGELIDAISALEQTQSPKDGAVLLSYGLHPGHNPVRAEAIPQLIETLDGTVKNKAWWILIRVQPSCPGPTKEAWQQWWKEAGQEHFKGDAKGG